MKKHEFYAIGMAIPIILALAWFSSAKPFNEVCDGKGLITVEPNGFVANNLVNKCK